MRNHWHSNGKIILTGEYLVLFGAKALACPLKAGQSLDIETGEVQDCLTFYTSVKGDAWFEAVFHIPSLEIRTTNRPNSAEYIQMILRTAQKLNNRFLKYPSALTARANLDFNVEWGFGSSSTLISNIAWWADVSPFEINRQVSVGSSYDIACARSGSPIFYSYRHHSVFYEPVQFRPLCSDQMWLVYTGKKESTETNLKAQLTGLNPQTKEIEDVSYLSSAFAIADSVEDICRLIREHEKIMSCILKKEPVQTRLFNDFKGAIKSLGAWGGDFCLAVSEEPESYVKQYFEQKGLTTVLSFKEWVV